MSTWSVNVAEYLLQQSTCPRCGASLTQPGMCPGCRADLGGSVAAEVWEASGRAAEAVLFRQSVIDRLPTVESGTVATLPAKPTAAASIASADSVTAVIASPGRSSQISVQSVLAVAGAGLLAVAAVVFTFLNPELTNFGTRTAIVGGVTVLFGTGAWLLGRRGLGFSAEAIGALGAVFLALDVWAFSQIAPVGVSGFVFAGIGTLMVSSVLVCVAVATRLRIWLWTGIVGVALAPALLGYAADNAWIIAIGFVVAGFMALGMHSVLDAVSNRFSSPLRTDHITASVLGLIASVIAFGHQWLLAGSDPSTYSAGIAGLLLSLAALAALNSRFGARRLWSIAAGALFAAAFIQLPTSVGIHTADWSLALIPAAVGLGFVAVLALASVGIIHRLIHARAAIVGGWAILLAVTVPAAVVALGQISAPLDRGASLELTLSSILGLASAAAATVPLRRIAWFAAPVALWISVLAALTIATWDSFTQPTQVAVALGVAGVLTVLVSRVGPVARSAARLRAPLIAGAHSLVLVAAVVGWTSPNLSVIGGSAVVVAILIVSFSLPRAFRPLHVAAAYGYALVVFGDGMSQLRLETIAVLCLVTSVASLAALGATLNRRLGTRYWYAMLIVTAVPFLIGVASVLLVRSGWTALSTGVTFALALTLVVSRRPGVTVFLRAAAAALLVPALAVVVICLGAQVLAVSASPSTLPVIATIVAVVLPNTGRIAEALIRHGLGSADVRMVRTAIEVSSLITGALAVLLALVRVAAGFDTSFFVLVILGLGGAASAVFARRRYGWIVAAASWTGALWCFWAIIDVTTIEAYLLPPAIASAVVGAVAVRRGLSGLKFFWGGLTFAVLPTIGLLAVSHSDSGTPWRAYGLLTGSLMLIALAAYLTRHPGASGLRSLATPTAIAGIVAASGGAIQAVRYGWSVDALSMTDPQLVLLPVLALSVAATVFAALGATILTSVSRWLYAPAFIYLVVGPMAARRPGWLPTIALLVLALFLLAVMVATVARARTRPARFPPVWFLFALALCVAVTGWSERYLRVEAFSLPLGLALLAAGVVAMRVHQLPDTKAGWTSWPLGFTGSWRLLAPGIVATFLPSVLATGTDPQTLRAILVIGLALIAILVGSLRKLGAPFILGIIVLPIENAVVFVVQVGRSISAAPWWITLATAGAVLLVIAVTSERRVGSARGVGVRLRDLS